jgi:hypothetical protein
VDFAAVEQFLRRHAIAAALVAAVVAPATWAVSSTIHAERLAALEERTRGFQERITSLEDARQKLNEENQVYREATRRREQLRTVRTEFSDLFTPSPHPAVSR